VTAATAQIPAALHDYLEHPSLAPLWCSARIKLERNALIPCGVVTVNLDEDGASRLGGLLGICQQPGRARVSLAALDETLRRSAAAAGLVAVLGAVYGSLVDRAAAREQRETAWAEMWTHLDALLADAGLAAAPWVPAFVDSLHHSGILARAGVPAANAALASAVAALRELAPGTMLAGVDAAAEPRWELAELAGRLTGDAHGFDDGRLAGALVLRAAAAAADEAVPASTAGRRRLWETLGVATDTVSGTALVWGLRPPGRNRWAAAMRERANLGLVTHLTVHELRATPPGPLVAAGQQVFACENPQVLQAAARARVAAPLVCLAGNPSMSGLLLLRRLIDGRADLTYHGDFDWPGVAIATRVMGVGARPWSGWPRSTTPPRSQTCPTTAA